MCKDKEKDSPSTGGETPVGWSSPPPRPPARQKMDGTVAQRRPMTWMFALFAQWMGMYVWGCIPPQFVGMRMNESRCSSCLRGVAGEGRGGVRGVR